VLRRSSKKIVLFAGSDLRGKASPAATVQVAPWNLRVL